MLLPQPEVCQGTCAAWARIRGDDVYALEERRDPSPPLTPGNVACKHRLCSARIVTLTTPAFIVAAGPTLDSLADDWAAVTAAAAPPPAPAPGGVLGRLLAPRGAFPHKPQPLMLQGLDAGHLAHLHAHESVLLHAFARLGGYLRVLGYPLPPAQVGLGLVLALLAATHGCVVPLALALPLLLLARLHAAVRRHLHHIPGTLQEVPDNLGAATLSLAELGTLLDRVAGVLLWRCPPASAVAALALAAATTALLAPRCDAETVAAALLTGGPIAAGLALYFGVARVWSGCVAQWLEQARALEQALKAPGAVDGLPAGAPKKLNGDVSKGGAGFLPAELSLFVAQLAPSIGPVAGVFGVGMLMGTMLLAALGSPDCQCEWMEDWRRFPLLSEAAMYPPQRELFAGAVVGTAALMYLAMAALLERLHAQLPSRRADLVRMHRTLIVALVNLCGLGLLDMKRFFAPHVVTAYLYFIGSEVFFVLQTVFLFQLFAAAPEGVVTRRHRLPLVFNFGSFLSALAFWYCYTQELPIRSYVEISALMCQMLSVGASGPLINEWLLPTPA